MRIRSVAAGCDFSRSVLVDRAVPGSVEAPDPVPLPPPPAPSPRCRLSTLLTAHHSSRKPAPPQINILRTRTLPFVFLGKSQVPTRAPARKPNTATTNLRITTTKESNH